MTPQLKPYSRGSKLNNPDLVARAPPTGTALHSSVEYTTSQQAAVAATE